MSPMPRRSNAFVAKVAGELGTVHVALNNAVYRVDTAPFLEVPDEDWERSFRVNMGGPRNICRAVLPLMIKQPGAASSTSRASIHCWAAA